jgi:hypothetical protein
MNVTFITINISLDSSTTPFHSYIEATEGIMFTQATNLLVTNALAIFLASSLLDAVAKRTVYSSCCWEELAPITDSLDSDSNNLTT